MTELRKRMIEDMQLHGYAERTQKSYADAVKGLANHYQCSPDQLDEEDIRRFFLHLIKERRSSPSTVKIYLSGIKFFYEKTLKREWKFFELACPRKIRKLPVVLTSDEVQTILDLVRNPVPRVALTMIYSCGLRLSEGVNLLVSDIDSKRMQLRIRGKGSKERYVPLPEKTIELLRSYWKLLRPTYWLFPSKKKDGPVSSSMLQRAFRDALSKSEINKAASIHTLRHSYATYLLEEAVDLRVIQELLGHSSPVTTAIYTHLTQKSLDTLSIALSNLLPDH
jgi:integrase/recombinase XerD